MHKTVVEEAIAPSINKPISAVTIIKRTNNVILDKDNINN